ncbi:ester cyclase [Nocardia sp. NPDC051832]|uniref:ester cyclase n=1 Tax=Nocardia sp. NPDC051832 TaxID=3155673 RepID=UPI0034349FEA
MITLPTDLKSVAIRSIELMTEGTPADFAEVVHPDGITRERKAAPPAARGTGPEAFYQLASWLSAAISDLSYEIHCAAAEGDLVTLNTTMRGRHTGPVVFYDEQAEVEQAFAPTGKTFEITQSHWFRMREGKIAEHWANRDDLGMALQLGWVPPTPMYLLRCAKVKRAARKALRA